MTVQPTRDRDGFWWLDQIDDAVERHAYDCTCQVGGVDAMSIDTDWLRHAGRAIRHEHRAMAERAELAEHRIARLEAQTGIRGRAVIMYRERAREAEARIADALALCDEWEAFGTRSMNIGAVRRALESVPPPRA